MRSVRLVACRLPPRAVQCAHHFSTLGGKMQAKCSAATSGQHVRAARARAVRSPGKQFNSSTVRSQQVATKVAFADTAETVGLKEEPQKRYILGELLGSGTAAHVHVGTDTATGLQHAVKILPKRKGTKDKTKLIKAEVRGPFGITRDDVCRHAYCVVVAGTVVKVSKRLLAACGNTRHGRTVCKQLCNADIKSAGVISHTLLSWSALPWHCMTPCAAKCCLTAVLGSHVCSTLLRCCLQIQISNKLRHCRHAVQTVDTFEVCSDHFCSWLHPQQPCTPAGLISTQSFGVSLPLSRV
jgi:hypothetical protein